MPFDLDMILDFLDECERENAIAIVRLHNSARAMRREGKQALVLCHI